MGMQAVMMLCIRAMHHLDDYYPYDKLGTISQYWGSYHLWLRTAGGEGLDVRIIAHILYQVSEYLLEVQYFGSVYFSVTTGGQVTADGSLGPLRRVGQDPGTSSTFIAATA